MEEVFLILIAGIWLAVASIQDIKKREVPNWLSFSLITFALSYRGLYSVINNNLMFFVYGVAGFLVFVGLAYAFYYMRIFAGGDAKLLMGLGAILPLASSINRNILFLFGFVILLMLAGGAYGLVYSVILVLMNKEKFSREFKKQISMRKNLLVLGIIFSAISLIFVFSLKEPVLFFLPLMMLIFPIVFIYGKTVEESCMIKLVPGNKVTVGDWLYEEVSVERKKIKPYWEGLSEKEVELLKNYKKKVKIKQGIPFIPVFLISFLIFLYLVFRF